MNKKKYLLNALILFFFISSHAQKTVGLINYQTNNLDGYVLFSPMTSTKTYLINKCGENVHEWNTSTSRPALSCYLTQDGSLLRTAKSNNPNFTEGGNGGLIEKFDWNGNLVWSYVISDTNYVQHHDIKLLPNGNILAIVWDRYSNAQAKAMGKNITYTNMYLLSEKIIEIQPVGTNSANIVWEWKVWDHMIQDFDNTKPNFGVVATHPELMNINYFPGAPTNTDWIHFNSIDYNAATDQILLSAHTLSEVWIIDHSTTTAEASSHAGGNSGKGGDILYRWGNPQSYQRGSATTKVLYGQHHASWIPTGFPNEGKILVFNNGLGRTGTYSSIDMIETPINSSNQYPIGSSTAFLPTALHWTYTDPTPSNFYSSNISGVYPLSNGSFVACLGASGIFLEIDSNKNTLWKYINPVAQTGIVTQGNAATNNTVFRCEFYPSSYPAFVGRTLTSLGEIEINPTVPSICDTITTSFAQNTLSKNFVVYPNPVIDNLVLNTDIDFEKIEIYNSFGRLVFSEKKQSTYDLSKLNAGIYLFKISTNNGLLHTIKIFKQ